MTVPVNLRQPKKPKKSKCCFSVNSLAVGDEYGGSVSWLVGSRLPVLADLGKGEGGTTVWLVVASRLSARDLAGSLLSPVVVAFENSNPQAGQNCEVTLRRKPQRGHFF